MSGSKSRVLALAAVGGCFLAFWAPASAQGPASPTQPVAQIQPAAGSAASGGEFPAESGVGTNVHAKGPNAATPADSTVDLNRTAAAVRLAWRAEADGPAERARRARRVALHHGMWNFDPAARELIGPGLKGAGLEQAQAAVVLSPDLPAARMALAREIWMEGDSPIAAVRTAMGALLAIPRHFEASIWFSATILCIGTLALIAGGLLTLAIYGARAFLHAAHDLGDLVSSAMPGFSRAALLGALVLAPLALQQGLFGLALALFSLGLIYGATRQRLVLCVAAIAVLAGMFPMARLVGTLLTTYADSPIEAAILATDGFVLPADVQRLESAAENDPMAAMALAITDRRAGNLSDSVARYRRLLQQEPANYTAANNAANLNVELNQLETAIDLYQQSAEAHDSATVLFNLSQAQGQAFKLDDVGPTLAAAQRLDSERVAELTLLQGSDLAMFTIDFPLPRRMLWDRVLADGSGESFVSELRSAIAPGVLGRSVQISLGAFGSVAILSLVGGARVRRSQWCSRCGRRMCPRCEPELGGEEECESCNRLFKHPETTDREMRAARVNALRSRELRLARFRLIGSIFLPGFAGAWSRCPWASLIGSLTAAVAILAVVWRNGISPDPLMAGAVAPMVFGLIAALAVFGYAASVAISLSTRNRS